METTPSLSGNDGDYDGCDEDLKGLRQNTSSLRCFQEQLDRAQELKDLQAESQALGNMGITRMNLTHFEEDIVNFEQQLASLETGGGEARLKRASKGLWELGRLLRRPWRPSGGLQIPRECLQLVHWNVKLSEKCLLHSWLVGLV